MKIIKTIFAALFLCATIYPLNSSAAVFMLKKTALDTSDHSELYLRYTKKTGLVELGKNVERSKISLIRVSKNREFIECNIQFTANSNFLTLANEGHSIVAGNETINPGSDVKLLRVYSNPVRNPQYIIQSKTTGIFLKCDNSLSMNPTTNINEACIFDLVPLDEEAQQFASDEVRTIETSGGLPKQLTFSLRKVGGSTPQFLRYTASTNKLELGQLVKRSNIDIISPFETANEITGKIKFNASDRFLIFNGSGNFDGSRKVDLASDLVFHKVQQQEQSLSFRIQSKTLGTYLACNQGYEISQTPNEALACQFQLSPTFEEENYLPEVTVHTDPRYSPYYLDRLDINLNITTPLRKSSEFFGERKLFLEKKLEAQKRPDIFIIFVDTLRKDYLDMYAPNMKRFLEDSVTPRYHWSSGTATVYTTFSMLHSMPPFLTYDYGQRKFTDPDDYGAFPLKVLQKLGYDINVFGFEWGCLNPNGTLTKKNWRKNSFEKTYWYQFLRSYFGEKTNMIAQCRTDLTDKFGKAVRNNNDADTVDLFRRKIRKINQHRNPHFYFINIYNVHGPHKWNPTLAHPLTPSQNDRETGPLYQLGPNVLRNSYANAVRSADDNVRELLELIHSQQTSNNLIILMSDHGELLGEKLEQLGHGKRAYRERNEAVMSFNFGRDNEQMKHRFIGQLFSSEDIFPTIFDYMDVLPSPISLLSGKSLLDGTRPRNSTVTIRANGSYPTYEMTLSNNDNKVYLYIETGLNQYDDNFAKKSAKVFYNDPPLKVKVFDITDLDDKPVFNKSPFSPACNPKASEYSPSQCKAILLRMFPDAFEELFPGITSGRR